MRGEPLALRLYAGATAAAGLVAPALLRRRAARGKEDPARRGERLGRPSKARPEGGLVWLHGASVGESLSLLPLVDAFRESRPDLGLLVTSGTVTSAALMAQRLPPGVIHQYAPIDTPAATAGFLGHWRPGLGVFAESELWPNLLLGADRRGTKLALLSAKLSDASFRGWRRAPASARRLFGAFDLILAQDARAAERLAALGAKPAGFADLKFGAIPLPVDETALAARRAALGERVVVLAASTHPGEEALALDAWRAAGAGAGDGLLTIVPRHPERGPPIAAEARAQGFDVRLQSAGEAPEGAVFVADALGELGLWFRLARLSVIGGSFVPGIGGHNPLEPARLGAPFVSGPEVANWATAYGELAAAGATRIIAAPAPESTRPLRLSASRPATSPASQGRRIGAQSASPPLFREATRGRGTIRRMVEGAGAETTEARQALAAIFAEALDNPQALADMAEKALAHVAAKDAAAHGALSQVLALAP